MKNKKNKSLSNIFFTYVKPYINFLIIVLFGQIIQTTLTLWLPTETGDMISKGVALGDTHYVKIKGSIMIIISLGQVICTIVSVYFSARIALGLGKDLRLSIFSKVEDFSQKEVSKFGVPSLITRTTNDVQQIQMFFYMTLSLIITAPIIMLTGIVLTFTHNKKITLILAVSLPLLCSIIIILGKIALPAFRKMQKTIDKANRVLREQLTGIKVIRAFVKDDFEHERFDKVNIKLRKLNTKIGRLMSCVFPLVMVIINITNIFVFFIGAKQIDSGKMQIGSLTAISTYVVQILISLVLAAMLVFLMPRAQISAKRIKEVLNTKSSISLKDNSGEEEINSFDTKLKNASFIYSGANEPVVENISFDIKKGTKTSIIGSTGSGKSTILNLIIRLFDTTSGSIEIDGKNIKNVKLSSIWKSIGLAPQKAFLFSGTIKSNLLFGNSNATDDEIWDALEIAQAKDFVNELPDKLNAPIAQGGSNFSGGQKQRLSIARMIIKKPNIYLFDDSFSALDFSVDAKLRNALKPITKNAAVVIVAQRVGTIMDSDQIIVLDNGKIVGKGKHNELIKTCSTYQEIAYSQLSKKELETQETNN